MARYQNLDVTLHRDALHTPWGFRLKGGVDYDQPLVIERVTVGGSAEGQLRPGDQLLSLQGQIASQLAHQEATNIILNSGSQLSLSILRPITANQTTTTQPTRQKASSVPRWGTSNDNEPPKIATNSNLAKLMTNALSTVGANGPKRWSPSRCSAPTLRKGPTMASLNIDPRYSADGSEREQDITLFLPRRPSGRLTPLPQVNEPHTRQMRDAITTTLRIPPPATTSGRTTPRVVEIAMASPMVNGSGHRPSSAIGFWTPPDNQPNSKLVHMQYNSPMNLYTPNNVAEMIEKHTGSKLAWRKKPPVRFLDDIEDSPTYQFVQTMERQQPPRAQSAEPINQSLTLRNMQRYFDRANVY